MRPWCRVLCALAALAPPAAARAGEIRLHLVTHGAVSAAISAAHTIDVGHFCSAAADPWVTPNLPDLRATPFPFYRLIFGQNGPAAELDRPGPSLGLALSNYFAAARDHADPVNDSIELVVQGRHFIGHAGLSDPGYHLAVTYRVDRAGGDFVARGLRESGGRGGTLDVEGSWQCPPVTADMPEQQVAVHALFPGAKPVRKEPAPLRLSHSDIPCLDRGCARWRVTDEDTGAAYLARVDFSRLRLARGLRREAERGEVDLLVAAEVHRGEPPRVVALMLDGVEPTASAPTATPAPAPAPAPAATARNRTADAIPEAALY